MKVASVLTEICLDCHCSCEDHCWQQETTATSARVVYDSNLVVGENVHLSGALFTAFRRKPSLF